MRSPASRFSSPAAARRARVLFGFSLAASSVISPALRAVNIWDGGAGTGNWADANNWDTNAIPATTGQTLTFGGTLQLSTNNNSSITSVSGLTFSSGAGAFTLAGTGLTLAGNVLNSSTNLQTVNLNLATTAVRTFTMTTGGGNIAVGGNISGTNGGITTAGTGTLTLSGTNSYTGATTVANNTTLQFNSAASMSSSSALTLATGSTLALRGDADTTFTASSLANTPNGSITVNVNQLTGAGANKTLTLSNNFTTTATSTINVTGGNGYTLGLGAITGAGNSSDAIFNVASGVGLKIASFTGSTTGNDGILVQGAGNTTFTGGLLQATSNARNLTLNIGSVGGTTGVVTLSGANWTATGTTGLGFIVLNSGTLALNNTAALGARFSNLTINGGTLDATVSGVSNTSNPTQTWNGDFVFTGTNNLNMGTGVVTVAGNRTVTVAANTLTSGSVTGGGTYGITKAGAGTLTLGGFAIPSGGAATIADAAGVLNLGAVTRSAGGTADFSGSNIAGIAFSGTAAVASGANTGNILVSNAANGAAYATANGGTTWATVPAAGTVGSLSTYATGIGNYTSLNNVDATTGDSVSGVTVNTLRLNGASTALTLAGTNVITTGGILVTPGSTGATISGGTITGNANANREVIVHNYGTLNVGSAIANNAGATALTLTGTGTTTLSGANTYTGATTINRGTVKLGVSQVGTTSSALGAGAPTVVLGSGATLDLSGFNQTIGNLSAPSSGATITSSTGGVLTLTANYGANVALTGNMSLVWNSGATEISTNFSNQTYTGGTVISSPVRVNTAPSGINSIFGSGAITLDSASTGRLYLNNGGYTFLNDFITTANSANLRFSANGQNDTFNGAFTGSGTLNMADSSNTFGGIWNGSGSTATSNTAFSGSLVVGSVANTTTVILTSPSASSASAKYVFGNATNATALNATAGLFLTAGTGTATGTYNLGELSTATGITNATLRGGAVGTTTFSVGALGTSSTYAGLITNGTTPGTMVSVLTKVGTGTLTLSGANTYTGGTNINGGVINLGVAQNGTTSGPLGASGTISFGGGTLQYSASNTTDYSSRFSSAAGQLYSVDTNNQSVAYAAGLNSVGGSLSKSGLGTLTLSNVNNYTGTTTVSGGTLKLDAADLIASSTILNIGSTGSTGAKLDVSTPASFTVGATQTLSGIGTIDTGASTGRTVTINGILAPGNSIGTNAITGDLVLGSSSSSNLQLGTAGTRASPGLSDRTSVTGSLQLGGTLSLSDNAGANGNGSVGAGSYQVFTQAGTATGSFNTVNAIGSGASVLHPVVDTATSGAVYVDNYRLATAAAPANTASVGITRVGGSFGGTSLSLTNSAASDGYSENLKATVANGTGASGTGFATLAAGSSGSVALSLASPNTSTSGLKSGTVDIVVASVGAGTFADTTLHTTSVTVSGQVNEYATPVFSQSAGSSTFGGSGTSYSVNFGTVAAGTGTLTADLSLVNSAINASFQDTLGGSFVATSANAAGFNFTGLTVGNLAAGAGQSVAASFDLAGKSGTYSGSLVFSGLSKNASDLNGAVLGDITVAFSVNVSAIPEPSTYAAIFGALALAGTAVYRRRQARK